MTLNALGNLGIGTTSPDSRLHVGPSNGAQLRIDFVSSGDNYYDGVTHYFRNGNGAANIMTLLNGGNVGIGTTSPATRLHVRGASTGTLTSVVYFEDNSTNQNGLAVRAGTGRVDLLATWGGTGINTDLTLTPTNSSGAQNEAMRITSGGNVEIATGSIKTGEPDTGWGRAAIKIGARQSGEAFSSGGYLPVNVDGTVYYINLYSSTP
jgi:hypothetical protein